MPPKRKRLTAHEKATQALLKGPRCYWALLEGIAALDSEGPVENDEGYGLVAQLPGHYRVLMRPIETIAEAKNKPWATPGELVADFRYTYQERDLTDPATIKVHSIKEHAVYAQLGCRPSTSTDSSYRTPFSPNVHFVRSFYDSEGNLHETNTICYQCKAALKAEAYVHCQRCKHVFHAQCTEAQHDQPFILQGGKLYDSLNQEVPCPSCKNTHIRSQVIAPKEHCDFFMCIDIGSEKPKVSVKWASPAGKMQQFKSLDALPVSAVTIIDGDVHTYPQSSAMRCAYDEHQGSENGGIFTLRPLKKILFDENVLNELIARGKSPTEVFQVFFKAIFESLKSAHRPELVQWAKPAIGESSTSHPVRLRLAIALPSGLPMDRKQPVLTALFNSAKKFMGELNINDPEVNIHELPESEMALLGTVDRDPSTLGDARWVAVFDVGGSTSDFSLHEIHEDRSDYKYELHAAQSYIYGQTEEVAYLMSTFPQYDPSHWDALKLYVETVRASPEQAASLLKNPDLQPTWERHYTESQEGLSRWVNELCTQTERRDSVAVLLTGGGLLEQDTGKLFENIIKKSLPEARVQDKASTTLMSSIVLKGLQVHVDHLGSEMDRSPVSILFKTDNTLDPESEHCSYIILTNKGDPLGPYGLLNPAQPRRGEVITCDVAWTENGDFELLFYTYHEKIKETTIYNGLLATSSLSADQTSVIARITIAKPSDCLAEKLFFAAWPEPRGRTIRTVIWAFNEEDAESLDIPNITHEKLDKAAVHRFEQVHGLDTYGSDRFAVMKQLSKQTTGT